MDLMPQVTTIAANISNKTALKQSIVDTAAKLTSSTRVYFLIEDASIASYNPHLVDFTDMPEVPHHLFNNVVLDGETITDPTQIPDSYLRKHNPKVIYCTPIIFEDETLGVLYLEGGNNYETEQFKSFLRYVNTVMSEAKKYHQIQETLDQSVADLKHNQRLLLEKTVENKALVAMVLSGVETPSDMSIRQHTILTALAKGSTIIEIASKLSRSEKTIRNNISIIVEKLGAKNISNAIAIATHYKMISIFPD